MKTLLLALTLLAAVAVVRAAEGVDVSQPYNAEHFKCLKAAGLHFASIRAYQSVGHPDPNAPGTIAAAHAAGLEVDVYMFPCPKCGNPEGQVNTAVSFLNQHGAKFGTFWLDIEGTQYWTSSQAHNREFFEGLVKKAKALGLKVGVYSSASQWNPIFGSYSGGSELPLWYAHYDNTPSFADFKPFAGWHHPSIKQFSDKGNKCGVNYDINWKP